MNKKPSSKQPNQIKQLNFKVPAEFYWKLKNFAISKRLKMGEVLEKAFKFYEKREQIINEINTYRQTIPAIEQQIQPFQGNIKWAELEARTNNLVPVFFNRIGLVVTYEVFKETLEQFLIAGRRLGLDKLDNQPNLGGFDGRMPKKFLN